MHQSTHQGVETDFLVQEFDDAIVVFVSQTGSIASVMQIERATWMHDAMPGDRTLEHTVQTVLGDRNNEVMELMARQVAAVVWKGVSDARLIVLGCSLVASQRDKWETIRFVVDQIRGMREGSWGDC